MHYYRAKEVSQAARAGFCQAQTYTDVDSENLRTPEYPVATESKACIGFLRLSLADTKVTWAGAQELSKETKDPEYRLVRFTSQR